MIIWRGWGIVVVGIALLAALAAGAVAEALNTESTTTLLGIFLIPAGILTWFVGKRMNRDSERTLVDPKTGEPVVIRNDHSLFFVRVEWWGPIMVVAGIISAIVGLTSPGR